MRRDYDLRYGLVDVCRTLERKGLIAATDGNVSCRAGDARLLVTPSGRPKGELAPIDLLVTDLEGVVLNGTGRPSTEIRMHLLIYSRRPDVQAVVHAHPPMLTALTLAGVPFVAEALPEVWLTIGAVPTAPYATPSTQEVPDAIAPFVDSHQAILMERHGSITMGHSLREAYLRLEKLEHAAHTLFFAHQMLRRPATSLESKALQKLKDLR
ncbi:MAG: class II aldolase/adducin family protein [Syntrophobacteraceae bacterium]